MVLKMKLISYLNNFTQCQVEEYINENLPAKFLFGLAAEQSAPDNSALPVFRDRLIKRDGRWVFEESLQEIVWFSLVVRIGDTFVMAGIIYIFISHHWTTVI